MTETLPVPLGRYRHYKGNEYTVIGVARHQLAAILALADPHAGHRGHTPRGSEHPGQSVERINGFIVGSPL